jgi:hypothetical protein
VYLKCLNPNHKFGGFYDNLCNFEQIVSTIDSASRFPLTRTLQEHFGNLIELARLANEIAPEEYMKVESIVSDLEKASTMWSGYEHSIKQRLVALKDQASVDQSDVEVGLENMVTALWEVSEATRS